MKIRRMEERDWKYVEKIWIDGIKTKIATFRESPQTYEEFDKSHDENLRFVLIDDGIVVAWSAITMHGKSPAYKGVGELSIYVSGEYRGKGYGKKILNYMIEASEKYGYRTLLSVIIKENVASIMLHKSCGFRVIGTHEKIARTFDGVWHDTVFLERRSKVIDFN